MNGEIGPAGATGDRARRVRPGGGRAVRGGGRTRLWAVCAALVVLLGALALPASGASAPPSPEASDAISLTGHWAIAGTSGIDLVQRGSSLSGTSEMGISLSGTVSGDGVSFRWWRGGSYAAAKKADRGTGTMTLDPNGEELSIAAKDDEAGPGPFPTAFQAVRVHDIVSPSASPKVDWYGSWLADDLPKIVSYSRAYLDYVVTAWMLTLQTGYWPSPAVAWIQVEDQYKREGKEMLGGWLPNGGGPAWVPPAARH